MIVEREPVLEKLTLDVAKRHAQLPQIKGDRNLTLGHVQALRDVYDKGLFHTPTWAVVYCKENGVTYRFNGKHSSHMLCELNGSFPTKMKVMIIYFECDHVSELPVCFDQFDKRWSVRSPADSMNVHKSLHAELHDVSKTNAQNAVQGIAWYVRNVAETVLSVEEQSQLVHQYPSFIATYAPLISTNRMKRTGVIAAMFGIWMVNGYQEKIIEFWRMVRDQTHEDVKNGSRTLGKFLELAQYNVDPSTRKNWDPRAFYFKCVHAWNAYVQGISTDLKYHVAAPFPKIRKLS